MGLQVSLSISNMSSSRWDTIMGILSVHRSMRYCGTFVILECISLVAYDRSLLKLKLIPCSCAKERTISPKFQTSIVTRVSLEGGHCNDPLCRRLSFELLSTQRSEDNVQVQTFDGPSNTRTEQVAALSGRLCIRVAKRGSMPKMLNSNAYCQASSLSLSTSQTPSSLVSRKGT